MKNNKKKKKITINDYACGNEANYRIPKRILSDLEKKNLEFIDKLNKKPNDEISDNQVLLNQESDEKILKVFDDSTDLNNDYQEMLENKKQDSNDLNAISNLQQKEYNNDISDDVLLEVNDVVKRYSKKAKPAIDGISFKVRKGEFHAFVGANGAGKTTTIKSIVGAYAKFKGEIKICGIDNKSKFSRSKLGYIPEIARFPSRISAYKYLNSMAMLNGLSKEDANKFTNEMLDKFNMTGLKNSSPNKFSSGQKKKILLIQALSNDPDILIMDEPAANLDPRSRIEFFDILKELQQKGKAIFISSHILSELDIYADAITILDGGKIVYTGKRKKETYNNNEYSYKIVLNKENDFANISLRELNLVQDKENKNHYIVSSNNHELLNDFISKLFSKQKLIKVESYSLSIEDMYKKYVIKGSVHTSL